MTCFDTICYTYTNGVLTKTVDKKDNETVTTTYLYDEYGNTEKTTTLTEKDSASDIGIVECTYDVMGNMLSAVSGDESSSYIYDEAGRTLLADEKGDCTRAVYDSLGRIVQEIAPEDYDSTKDGLPESKPMPMQMQDIDMSMPRTVRLKAKQTALAKLQDITITISAQR